MITAAIKANDMRLMKAAGDTAGMNAVETGTLTVGSSITLCLYIVIDHRHSLILLFGTT